MFRDVSDWLMTELVDDVNDVSHWLTMFDDVSDWFMMLNKC